VCLKTLISSLPFPSHLSDRAAATRNSRGHRGPQQAGVTSCGCTCASGPRARAACAPRQRRLTCWHADRLEPGTASSWRVAAWSTGAAPPSHSGPAARPHAWELLVPRGRCLMRPWPALAAPRMQAATLGRARWSRGTCLMRAWCAPPVGAPHGPSRRHRVRPRRARLRRGGGAPLQCMLMTGGVQEHHAQRLIPRR
jgi:hypothetical protein